MMNRKFSRPLSLSLGFALLIGEEQQLWSRWVPINALYAVGVGLAHAACQAVEQEHSARGVHGHGGGALGHLLVTAGKMAQVTGFVGRGAAWGHPV